MQNISRKRRSYKRFRGFGICTIACIQVILSSCSLFENKKTTSITDDQLKKEIQAGLCLSASGRGRITTGKEKNRFTYQSQIKNHVFELAIDIPFKGQETLKLPLRKPFKFSGSIYSKTKKELSSSKHRNIEKIFDAFLFRSAKFFAYASNEESCENISCLSGTLEKLNDAVAYQAPISKRFVFDLELKNNIQGHYRNISIRTSDAANAGKPLLALDLIVDSCQ